MGGGQITVPIVTASITGLNRHYKVPTSYQYSVGVQQALGKDAVFSASYVVIRLDTRATGPRRIFRLRANWLVSRTVLCTGTQPTFNSLVPFLGYQFLSWPYRPRRALQLFANRSARSRQTRPVCSGRVHFARAIDPATGNGGNGFDLNNISNPYVAGNTTSVRLSSTAPTSFSSTSCTTSRCCEAAPIALLKTGLGGWQLSGIVSAPMRGTTQHQRRRPKRLQHLCR